MSIFHGMNISGSALTSQRLRMDVISANMANAETTRARQVNGEWEPYRRKMIAVQPNEQTPFSAHLHTAMKRSESKIGNGVKVSAVVEDQTPFKLVYQPDHPDANEEGYVEMPNVDPLREMVDLMSATRSYEANVTTLNASKNILMKALEIGR
ncbi:flagellar basal body rod protein FlgC [Halalkalibacterium halodurans]|uniref:flagellar basal body rod protein FlgC n=1 Tax=Halalkalibacterium halodurans TaxID=86665 RepID=UPI002E1D2239|nr:flagellar basal body rod protein FlgC [Halalkalibacterium halodurans]MED4081543.1 flagellar basal body rod protein FlgC [Halalkalibacterium halodurans]MED4086159.1 flagellar basal body rod protein FlgC [Halalkalibacterium halodurans]MED4106199.1 flagellar basal body rod protein FlgC [Halalkalibacterium halodurans]MED4108612.1 flagellar basal body rod protein FlgC [Halalkalibacterium halodurans]MED4124454.1 flagellar basal body rod protein FlgC [Halalkalibacterium halodurans]